MMLQEIKDKGISFLRLYNTEPNFVALNKKDYAKLLQELAKIQGTKYLGTSDVELKIATMTVIKLSSNTASMFVGVKV